MELFLGHEVDRPSYEFPITCYFIKREQCHCNSMSVWKASSAEQSQTEAGEGDSMKSSALPASRVQLLSDNNNNNNNKKIKIHCPNKDLHLYLTEK